MIRFMLDTDTPDADLPASHLFATYADLVPSTAAFGDLRARRPGSVIVLIDRGLGDPLGSASVCDIEPKAIWPPSKFGPWFARKHAAGIEYLTAYCSRSDLSAVFAAGPFPGTVWHWVATLDGTAHVIGFTAGHAPAAVQCLSAAMLGYHADGSLVFEDGWHPQPVVAGVALAAVRADAKRAADAADAAVLLLDQLARQ